MASKRAIVKGTLASMLFMLFVGLYAARAMEALPATPATEKISSLIKDLGSDVFDARESAEKELLKIGLPAQDALLKASISTDLEVKTRVTRILNQIKLNNLGAINYLDVFPANSIAVFQLPNIAASKNAYKKSAIGKIITSPELEPLRASIEAIINQEAPVVLPQISKWTSCFSGQVAGAVWEFEPMQEKISAALLAEITATNPVVIYNELRSLLSPLEQMGGKTSAYKGVSVLEGPHDRGAFALVGKHLIIAANSDSLQKIIDNLLIPANGFNSSPAFLKNKPKLNTAFDYLLMLNLQTLLTKITEGMPPQMGATGMLTAFGMGNIQWMSIYSAVAGEEFEDRFLMEFDGEPKGFIASSIPPAIGPAPMEVTALMPANAVAAAVGYFDGAKSQTALNEYLIALKNMMNFKMQFGGATPPDINTKIKEVETKVGIKLSDLIANIKGEIGYWVELATPPISALPHLGMLMTCGDANKAQTVASAIAKIANAMTGKPIAQETPLDEPGSILYQINLAAALPNVPPSFQYTPCWSAVGNRIFFASSVPALKKQLADLKSKAPGLLTQPEFVKAVALLSPEERRGQIFYVDVKTLLTLGAAVGLPMAQLVIPNQGELINLKKALAAPLNPQELFKNIPALMCSNVFKDAQLQATLHGPLSGISLYCGFVGAMIGVTMAQHERIHKVGGQQRVIQRGGGNLGNDVLPPAPNPPPAPDDF